MTRGDKEGLLIFADSFREQEASTVFENEMAYSLHGKN
jgi:hypothetical protein